MVSASHVECLNTCKSILPVEEHGAVVHFIFDPFFLSHKVLTGTQSGGLLRKYDGF